MKHPTSIALHAYWQGCHQPFGVPPAGIRAAELAPILPDLFLIDLDVPAGLQFRFCGASIAMRYGRDLTNESFLALWDAADRPTLEHHIKGLTLRSPGLVAGAMAEGLGGGFTWFEILVLPLRSATGATGAIGSMSRIGGHEEKNRVRARLVRQTLRSVRFLYPARREELTDPSPREAFAAEFAGAAGRRYGHLTVLSGGR